MELNLNSTTVATVDLAQLVAALRAWYSATGDARPNRILLDLGLIRARNGGRPDEVVERGLLLLRVQQWGPFTIPDPTEFPGPLEEVAETGHLPHTLRDPYPRGRSGGPRKLG